MAQLHDRYVIIIIIIIILLNLPRKFKLCENWTYIRRNLHAELHTFKISHVISNTMIVSVTKVTNVYIVSMAIFPLAFWLPYLGWLPYLQIFLWLHLTTMVIKFTSVQRLSRSGKSARSVSLFRHFLSS